jgi:SAM-dependent methyltransferase
MQYDPIKRSLGTVFNKSPFLRKTFYRLLNLLLLRTWHVHKELRQWMKKNPPDANILDAGSGFGQYTYWLYTKSWIYNIVAIDVKEEQVEDCNNFFNRIDARHVQFVVDDLTTYVKDDTYDLILSVDVMEHILEDVQVFRNFYRSLKKGGMLLISTPSDQGGSDVHGEDDQSFIEEHVRDGYNIREIEEKLRSAGFTNVETRYSYGMPGKISWRLSMKYPILMIGALPRPLGFILLPFYYLVAYPVAFILNFFDITIRHKSGTGLIVKAWK